MILVGSADADSHSLHLARAIEDKLRSLGAQTEVINLVEYGLPLYDRSIEREGAYDEKTKAFLDMGLAFDGYVWVTPIYHNSYSAMLKNALDWHHTTKFPGKVLGLASNGGNRSPQALDQLMMPARSMGFVTVPTRVCTDASDYDDQLELTNAEIQERITRFRNELVSYIHKYKTL